LPTPDSRRDASGTPGSQPIAGLGTRRVSAEAGQPAPAQNWSGPPAPAQAWS